MSDLDTRPSEPPGSGISYETENLGIAGKTARFFINSPLSPLFYTTMFLLGLAGLIFTPRQEDPQISVPMVDVFVQYPGASAEEVAALAIQPLERIMSEIRGVKHVYSAAEREQGIVTLEFDVGEQMGPSLVKVNDQLDSNMDLIPPGVGLPLVKAKGIDDVPVVTVTLWSERDYNGDGIPDVDDSQLRQLALSVLQNIKEIPETGEGFVVGGRAEQVIIEILPERLTGYGISLGQVAEAIKNANARAQVGNVEAGGSRMTVVTGAFLQSGDDINQLQVGNHNGAPVYVYDVAEVRQRPEDARQMVAYYTGAAADDPDRAISVPAVTIAIAKKYGTNGVSVAKQILQRVEELKGRMIPNDVEVSITRNYGVTADDKVSDLIFKLFVATGFVFLLVWAAFRALRPAIVVLLVIPVVLLFTIFSAWLMGFTIDRVSLFALIFSIGILVDDAIVVVENIYRRWLEERSTDIATAVDAVREVGNPTILATFTVIGALLPMGFVSGMMGPYMMPIPALGSTAMFISLFAAFIFTPWLAIHRWFKPSMEYLETAEKREHRDAERLDGLFRRILMPMIEYPQKALNFRLLMWGLFFVACSMFYFNWVAVKMLPLDNKPVFSVVLDMPEGTALAETANRANQIANTIRKLPEVQAVQMYVGTAQPFDFNGMVRHYYLRDKPWHAEIQVQLLHKRDRDRTSHEIVVDVRSQLKELMEGIDAQFSVVEMPPGPPVLQSVVAEVHGPDADTRRQVAKELTEIFNQAESLRDVDNYLRGDYDYWHFQVDREKADRRGISVDAINQTLGMALGGKILGDVKQRAGHEPVHIVIQVPLAERSQINRMGDILVQSTNGVGVPLRELGEFIRVAEDPIIYHKDLRPVEYVVADVGGALAAPVYGMFQVEDLLKDKGDGQPYITPDGVALWEETHWLGPPPNDSRSGIEWAGEWTVTFETFRDMGIAFGAALIVIYILVVWEFGNFRIPALIMAPIPLTLLGIIPAHALFYAMGWGGEFTATSMIGWIALAGIIVRNSILLVDFSIHELQKGTSVPEAVIKACKTRTRPILITAFALVCGSSVILFDPIFQGMAISLASGVLVSTVLTLIVIPLGCVSAAASLCEVADVECKELPRHKGTDGSGGSGASLWHLPVRAWRGLTTVSVWLYYIARGAALLLEQKLQGSSAKNKPVAATVSEKQVSEPAAKPRPTVNRPASTQRRERSAEQVGTLKKTQTPERYERAADQSAKSKPKAKAVAKPNKLQANYKKALKTHVKAEDFEPVTEKEEVKSAKSSQKSRAEIRRQVRSKAAESTAAKATKAKPANKAATKKKTLNGKNGTATQISRTATKKSDARRGIRLKSLDDSSGDGLN